MRKTELKSRSISFYSFNVMSSFIYTDLISNLLDLKTRYSWINFDLRWCIRSLHFELKIKYIIQPTVLFYEHIMKISDLIWLCLAH